MDVCDACGDPFVDGIGEGYTCCLCKNVFCEDCEPTLVEEICEGECIEYTYEREEDKPVIVDEWECRCASAVTKVREECPKREKTYHDCYICEDCLVFKDKYKVNKDELIDFLLEGHASFKTRGDAYEACRKRKKVA